MRRDIIVLGASAGGVYALKELIGSIPADLEITIFVVLHTSPYSPSKLPEILSRAGKFKAIHPEDGDKLEKGRIYVAPPDHHLLIEEGERIGVKKGPKENRFRPSVDALFRSAAYIFGARVIGIVLSGALDDGTSGMWAIKRAGGISIVQEPDEALYSSMPKNVMEHVEVDHVSPVADIGKLIQQLTAAGPKTEPELSKEDLKLLNMELMIAAGGSAFEIGIFNMGELSKFSCPECEGVLIQLKEGKQIRFRCHTGHAYSTSSLLASISTVVEEKMVSTVRALEEVTMLLNQIGENYEEIGNETAANKFLKKAEIVAERARILHEATLKQEIISEDIRFESDNSG